MDAALLEVTGLTKCFGRRADAADAGIFHGQAGRAASMPAVSNVNLSISERETMGLVGESGSGKTTLARMLAGTLEPTAGTIRYRGEAIERMTRRQKQAWLVGVQMMFQDPQAALNPRLCAADIISDAPLTHRLVTRRAMAGHVAELMTRVGLDPTRAGSYPHEFLPEERHRIALARALAVKPSLLVCDQFTSTLPPDGVAELLKLVADCCVAQGIARLLIGDRLAELAPHCERVAVLYRGHLLEVAPTAVLRNAPNHPYSQVRFLDERPGCITQEHDAGTGCVYRSHCLYAGSRCRQEHPRLREIAAGHSSACHLNDGGGP